MSVELVVVKAFRGIALVRWMIGVRGVVADITNEAWAKAIAAGLVPDHSVGFPVVDVFRADGTQISDGDRPDWKGMAPRF